MLLFWHRKWSSFTIIFIACLAQGLGAFFCANAAGQASSSADDIDVTSGPGPASMFLIIFWGMFVLRTAGDLCTEKRDRIREGMRMMGMNDMPYYWYSSVCFIESFFSNR